VSVGTSSTLALEPPARIHGFDPLLVASCRPPRLLPGLVARPRLIRQLMKPPRAPVALLVAPAGYGKTALLSEWAGNDERPFAWVSLDVEDNDPAHLLARVACALDPVAPVPVDALRTLSEVQAVVLALDDLHVLHEPAALAAVSAIRQVLRPGSALALASRADPALPVGRLRAHDALVELRARELAMTATEAGALLRGAGVELGAGEVGVLAQRTEGWPAALNLAALSLKDESDVHQGVERFGGDDRYVADYLRDEFLSQLSTDEIRFIRRTSVLEALSGPSCDAVLGIRRSAARLAVLARSNLPLVPLDRSDSSYRYHGLLRQMLRSELRRLEPDREAELHGRAARWFEDRGDCDRAIEHAVEAHDLAHSGQLLWRHVSRYTGGGRNGRVRRWLGRFTEAELGRSPRLALVAASTHLAAGDGSQAEHWTAVAAGGREHIPRSERDVPVEAGIAVMRAGIARDGVARMAEDAGRAYRLEPDGSPLQPLCRLIEGVAAHLAGDRERARRHLEEGMRRAAVQSPTIHALCLAQLALLALDEEDEHRSAWLAARAKALVERSSALADSPMVSLVLAVSAAARARRGQVMEATKDRRDAHRLLAGLTNFVAWYDCEARIVLARAALRVNDTASARRLLVEASRGLRQVPDAVVLKAWLDQLWLQAEATEGSAMAGGGALTTAELRVLHFLPSHLSCPEIARRLYVSPNTVKTHVRAVYRKLDASSRTEAVERARQNRLLDPRSA
jgi:LuxR family transcriptional regulator, maltose regulon positive regulatory protein